ncbi:hypothetical protein [Anaerotignum lactatifermentans]
MILNVEDAHTVVLSLTMAAAVAGAEAPSRIQMQGAAGSGRRKEQEKRFPKF